MAERPMTMMKGECPLANREVATPPLNLFSLIHILCIMHASPISVISFYKFFLNISMLVKKMHGHIQLNSSN